MEAREKTLPENEPKRTLKSVRALLVARNIKQKNIAAQFFIHPSEVCRVIQGKRKNPEIRKIIALVLNMTEEELWEND